MDRLGKHYPHLVGGWFLARKAAWAQSGCMATDSADYCMLVNEWAGSEHGFSFAVRAWTETEIRCICMLKVTSQSKEKFS